MDHRLIVAIGVFSMFVGVASVCSNPVTIIGNYYCNEKNISCLQCTEHTFYNGTCKTEYGDSHCPPCPSGTWNPKPYHLDRQCQKKKLNADNATDGKCIHPRVIEGWFYCQDTEFICKMCGKNTRYIGPCKGNGGPANCVPCEPETCNPSDFHMNKTCLPISPSNISENPDDDAVIQSPDDFELPQDQPRENVKEVKDQSLDSNQGIRLSMNPLLCFLIVVLYHFFHYLS